MCSSDLLVPVLLVAVGFVLVVELCSFLTIGASQGKTFTLSRITIEPRTPLPWAVAAVLLVGGGLWLRHAAAGFAAAWHAVADEVKAAGTRA